MEFEGEIQLPWEETSILNHSVLFLPLGIFALVLLLEAFPVSWRVGVAVHCTSKMEHRFGEAPGSEAKLRAPLQPSCTQLGSVASALQDQGSAEVPGACGSLLIKTTQAVRKVFIRASVLVQKRRVSSTGALESSQTSGL